MVEKFTKILNNVQTARGPITLLALLKMDEFFDKWIVVFSAPWSAQENRDEVLNLIKQQIIDNLDPQEISEIARIAIYSKTEHLIEELLKYQSGVELQEQRINGNKVHYAKIISSNPSA